MLAWPPSSRAGQPIFPNDPLYEHCTNDGHPDGVPGCTDEQWDLRSDGRGISADRAWAVTRGKGVVVASLDSGMDFTQPDLVDQFWRNPGETGLDPEGHPKCCNGIDDDHNGYVDDWRGWDFYENNNDPTDDTGFGHGTGTAGIVGAQQDNGIGISGVAPKVRLMVLRVSDTFITRSARLAPAIRYAVDNGANVITMSVGSTDTSPALRRAVAYAQAHNVVLVDAMANEFSTHPNSPAVLDPVIGVGGIVPDTEGTGETIAGDFTVKAGFSNYGPDVDVVAPTDTYTTDFGGGFGKMSGTSGATPHVAGVAALVLARAGALGLHLSSQEVTQIIRMSADDMVGGPYGYAKGWDQYTGWGRVDAARAVEMVTRHGGDIPPVADINTPHWYRVVTRPVAVRALASGRNGPLSWILRVGAGIEPSSWSVLSQGSGVSAFSGRLATFDPTGRPSGLYTLDLRVKDRFGHLGEDRQAFTVVHDRTLAVGFPISLGASAESAPIFADLKGNGRDDLIVADSAGRVHAFVAGGGELPGWPVREATVPTPTGPIRAGFVSGAAVANLEGSGPDVVIGGLDGRIYAWDASGQPLPGWPVTTTTPFGGIPGTHWESGIIGAPAIGEIDGDTVDGPEVVAGAADGKVYAFHANGTQVAGWPVLLQDPQEPTETAKVVSSPAIGDIDGDHHNEVVIGDGETYGGSARVYALNGNGTYHSGWPVSISAFQPNGIPVVGQGVPESPVLTDVDADGSMEVAIAGFTTGFHLLRENGTEMPGGAQPGAAYFSNTFGAGQDPAVTALGGISTTAGLAFGDLNRDGSPDLVGGSTDIRLANAAKFDGERIPFQHLVSAWHADSGGAYFHAFPRLVEDWMFLTAPILADVNGDGKPEIVIGNGDGYVHAFSANGSEPSGWPKYVGQWVQASAAAGDINGDHRTDIAVVTRQGFVFVFHTPGATSGLDWPNFRGTSSNTGVFVEP